MNKIVLRKCRPSLLAAGAALAGALMPWLHAVDNTPMEPGASSALAGNADSTGPAVQTSPLDWAGYPVDASGIADTGNWLGRIHLVEDPWAYIEAFEEFFAAYPQTGNGAWLYWEKSFTFSEAWQETGTWLGRAYGAGEFVYSEEWQIWFFVHRAEQETGTWLYAVLVQESVFPAERLFAWDAGVRGGIPDVPVAVSLDAADLAGPNAAPVIQAAINSVGQSGSPGAVLLPEGVFYITQGLALRSGVVLRGQGLDKTSLLMNNPDSNQGIISVSGNPMASSGRAILSGYEAGSRELLLSSTIGFIPGRMAYLNSDNDLDEMYGDNSTFREAGTTFARRKVAQVVEVVEVRGNTVVIDTPARLSRQHLNPTITPIIHIENAGIESLHLRLDQEATDVIVRFGRAVNCWMRDCELEYTKIAHVGIGSSRHVTIESNYMHHSYDYGGGGRGYGISAGGGSSDNLFWNNVFRMLRHAMLTSGGTNGNVWAYNYSREQHQDGVHRLRDISVHGHYPYMELFEGNVAEFATSSDWWGAAGPLITFFRNRFDTTLNHKPDYGGWNAPLQIMYQSHWQNVVGNSMISGQGIDVKADSLYALVEGNLVRGDVIWNEAAPWERGLPVSLFLSEPPHFWGDVSWPAIGSDVDDLNAPNYTRIPAQIWGERILSEGRSMPFHEAISDQ